MKLIVIQRDVIDGQSKGCWLAVQIGFTRFLFPNMWRRDFHAGAWLQLFIAAPSHDPKIGYRRKHFGIWFRTRRGRPDLRLSLRAGGGWVGLPKWML